MLYSRTCWSASMGNNSAGQYVIIDAGERRTIAGIVTQGCANKDEWVTMVTMQAADDASFGWQDVDGGALFVANSADTPMRLQLSR